MKCLGRKKVYQIKRMVGLSAKEISLITGIGINMVWHYKSDKRVEKNWKERELQIMTDMRSESMTYVEIGKQLNRSPNSVRIKMHRHRKEVLADPRKRLVLHFLKQALGLETDPQLALRALRKARIFEIGVDLK